MVDLINSISYSFGSKEMTRMLDIVSVKI